ncbi:MAG TPA: ABC transporter ATP-binding protein [Myxococcota bacterium]|nr:ABC transporter ATP-binding protein [Myxococcota bacterium]
MRVLVSFARRHPGPTVLVLVALVVAGIVEGFSLTALLPVLASILDAGGEALAGTEGPGRVAVEALERQHQPVSQVSLILLVLGGIAARSLLVLLAKRQVGYTVAYVATDLRLMLMRALLQARWEYFLRQPVGKLANAMSTEADRSSRAYLHGTTMLAAAVQLVAYVSVALYVQWQATLIYLAAAGVVVGGLHSLVRVAHRAGKRITGLNRDLLTGMTDALQSVKPLKAMAREDVAGAVMGAQARGLRKALRKEVLAKEGMKTAQEITLYSLVVLAGWAGLAVWKLPVSEVMVLLLLLARILNGVGKVQGAWQDVAVCESAYWSLQSTIQEASRQREDDAGQAPPRLERAIRFDDVHFTYDDQPILRGLTLEIPVGSFTTIVGHSGAGKTTLVDLLIGLLLPHEGCIWFDDVSLDVVDRVACRRELGYVAQENLLLHDSVRMNVTLGDPALTAADAERALRAAGAWDFVSRLDQGLESSVGERGGLLSGGQRQRILIARALVRRPQLLILDEATSALDPTTAAALAETLRGLKGQVTILAISHQPDLVEAADRVYQLEKGKAFLSGAGPAPER